ncbi:MAG: hypothetical protein AAGJ11_16275 [Bacteroidota bacterium]
MVALRAGLLVAVGALLAAAAPAERTDTRVPSSVAHADTLRHTVQAGETLIAALPAPDYRAVNAPALSWLVDRSFMWRTLPQERGTLAIRFEHDRREPVVMLVEIVG